MGWKMVGRSAAALVCVVSFAAGAQFRSGWPKDAERVWVGPEYWSNRLQDWRIKDGRLECVTSGGDRNVHLLTRGPRRR